MGTFLYHGTNTFFLKSIKEEGLCNPETSGVYLWEESDRERIYVTYGQDDAEVWAKASVKELEKMLWDLGTPRRKVSIILKKTEPVVLRFEEGDLPPECVVEMDPIVEFLGIDAREINWRTIVGGSVPPEIIKFKAKNEWMPLKDYR